MQINDSADYLIYLISCTVNGEAPCLCKDEKMLRDALSDAISHDLAAISYMSVLKLAQKVPDDIISAWKERYLLAVARNNEHEYIRKKIISALHKEGINTLEVQGTKVKKYYPYPEFRLMSDIDVIIEKENIRKGAEILSSMGFLTETEEDGAAAFKGKLEVELHSGFFSPGNEFFGIMGKPFDIAKCKEGCEYYLDDGDFYLFHLLHTVKHARFREGIGIRRILDLYYLDAAISDRDRRYALGILEKYGISEDIKSLSDICNYWFCKGERISDKKTLSLADDIKSAGFSGNNFILLKNELSAEQKEGGKFIKLRKTASLIFPPKEVCYKYYPALKEKKSPLLICWAYRFKTFLSSEKMRKNAKKVMKIISGK